MHSSNSENGKQKQLVSKIIEKINNFQQVGVYNITTIVINIVLGLFLLGAHFLFLNISFNNPKLSTKVIWIQFFCGILGGIIALIGYYQNCYKEKIEKVKKIIQKKFGCTM